MEYFAVKGVNEDSFGYDFNGYVWRGVIKEGPTAYKMVVLSGEDGVRAHQCALRNKILLPEDAVSTGDIAAPPGGHYSVTPAMGTEPAKAKKKRKQGGQVIVGEK